MFLTLLHQSVKKLLVIVGLVSSLFTQAQQVTGYWYGQANVDIAGLHNNYLTELIIQQKGNRVRGFFGYYFKDIYESFLVKGTYDPQTRTVVIRDIPIIYFNTNSTLNSVDCITSFYGKLFISKVKTALQGYFYRDKKYEYTCPDLRVNYTLFTGDRKQDSLMDDFAVSKKFWKPPADQYVDSRTAEPVPAIADAKSSDLRHDQPVSDSSETISVSAHISAAENTAAAAMENKIAEDLGHITESFKKRKNRVGQELQVSSDSLRLSFYDNGIIDGDSISVFLNHRLIIAHQGLTAQAFNIYVRLDSTLETNEVSMFAENLGKYPPNTALMVVNDGDNRYEIFMSSDYSGNATVRFKRKRE